MALLDVIAADRDLAARLALPHTHPVRIHEFILAAVRASDSSATKAPLGKLRRPAGESQRPPI